MLSPKAMVSGALLSLWPAAGPEELPLENQLELTASQLDVATRQRAMALEAVSEQVCTDSHAATLSAKSMSVICVPHCCCSAIWFGLEIAHI